MRNSVLITDRQTDRQTDTAQVHVLSCASQLKIVTNVTIWSDPIVTEKIMYFFLKLDHYWSTFQKKVFFAP